MKTADRPPIEETQTTTTRSSNLLVGSDAIEPLEPIESKPRAEQPCALCHRETAIGTLLHAARRRISDLKRRDMFVCAECNEAARASRNGEPLTNDELRNFVRAAVSWSSG
jgi:hypothetical protein